MDIQELMVFEVPNIYSLREPVVKIQVKLGELSETPTKDIGNLNKEIISLFPGIKDHKCSTGYVGGFVDRLKEGTYLAHVSEHLSLELQKMLGYDIKYGKARQVKEDIYNIIFTCSNTTVGKACGLFIINMMNDLIAGKKVDMDGEVVRLKKLCVKYELDCSTRAIITQAKKRGIPVSVNSNGELVRLGYGKYQRCILPALYKEKSAETILDMMHLRGIPFTIPIIAVTGSNGKTTVIRMLEKMLRDQGLTVGTSTSQGIFIDGRVVEEGDATDLKSAKRVLNDNKVEAAILETARGSIIRQGLAYDKADIAVFTNLSQDQTGVDDINTMDELLHAISLVIEAVKENGTCVMNADDPWVMKGRQKAKGIVILFTLDENNPVFIEHISNGGIGVCRQANVISIINKGLTIASVGIGDIPAALNVRLTHNIYNSMATIGAGFALGIPIDKINKSTSEFSNDPYRIPARFSMYDMADYEAVSDYRHNIDEHRVTIEGPEEHRVITAHI